MIGKLRKKLILAAMLAFFLVLAVIIVGINLWGYADMVRTAENTLTILEENAGSFPKRMEFAEGQPPEIPEGEEFPWRNRGRRFDAVNDSPELAFESRYWSVTFDSAGEISALDLDFIAAVDEDTARAYATQVYNAGKRAGFLTNYRYRRAADGEGVRVIFLDCTRSLTNFRTVLIASLVLSLVSLAVVLALLVLFSGRAVRPVAESYEKQKEFITNAGHEIKTPIAIINADLEVLALDTGENEFIDDIRKQTARLTGLTADLIFLSKMEEQQNVPMVVFPFSDLVEEAAESFRTLARTQGKTLETYIEPLLEIKGDEERLRQTVNILLDNAVKYCPEGGNITVQVEKTRSGLRLTVENTVESVEPEQLERMFDRFYRGDKSRSTAGYGLGLSIARAVADLHKGKLTATSPEGKTVKMTLTL